MAWRLANSLKTLVDQANHHAPRRNKASDGGIGDAAHQKSGAASDHNPHIKDMGIGVVTAYDITHDPASGVNTWEMAEYFRLKRDPRIKYVISNSRIFSATVSPWTWRKYGGSNPHRSHIHISVNSAKVHYDNDARWDIGWAPPTPTQPDAEARPILRQGDRGEWVRTVQRLLMIELQDGMFGPMTDREVRLFQRAEGLAMDGVIGPMTWKALDSIEQLPRPLNYDDPEQLSEPLEVEEDGPSDEFSAEPTDQEATDIESDF